MKDIAVIELISLNTTRAAQLIALLESEPAYAEVPDLLDAIVHAALAQLDKVTDDCERLIHINGAGRINRRKELLE